MKTIKEMLQELVIKNNKLIEQLNDAAKYLDEKYNMNSGGCGYFAYIVAKHLMKNYFKYECLQYFDDSSDTHPYHISIVIDDIVINESTCKDVENPYTKKVSMTLDELLAYYKECIVVTDWYKPYTSKYIKREIDKIFKEYEV